MAAEGVLLREIRKRVAKPQEEVRLLPEKRKGGVCVCHEMTQPSHYQLERRTGNILGLRYLLEGLEEDVYAELVEVVEELLNTRVVLGSLLEHLETDVLPTHRYMCISNTKDHSPDPPYHRSPQAPTTASTPPQPDSVPQGPDSAPTPDT